ncbi:MAG TPA: plastocyanin/azurin family copper-binding protein [Mycobacteriales bacterium]|nr:plastocyanin/azurin family copper-binding protein [Mycobacteriales bacterium]
MRRTATALVVGAVAIGAAACGGSSSGNTSSNAPANSGGQASAPLQHPASLVGVVGQNDAFTIQLSDGKGAPITHLAAGTYKLVVHDDSGIHDFHLQGSGVDDLTSVPEKGVKTFTVTFKPGTYTFVCDPHASQMHGQFTVS